MAYDASMLILIMAITQPTIYAMNIGGYFKNRKLNQLREKAEAGEEVKITQNDANKLCEGPAIDIPNILSKYFVLVLTCIFYAPLIPHAIPICCFGTCSFYLSYKYMLLRKHKMPEMFGEFMATFFANMMPLILVIWAISYQTFVTEINMAFRKEFWEAHEAD